MEYISSMNRQAMLYILNVNPQLQDIHFDNNKISYGSVTIDLGNFNLMSLLSDYSPFKEDVKLMDCQDFINIIGVNVLGHKQLEPKEEAENLRNNFYDVLDEKAIKYDPNNIVNGYNAFLYDFLCYQDYTDPEIKTLLDEFKQKMEKIEIDENAPEIAKKELDTFYKMQDEAMEYAIKFQNKQEKKLQLSLPQEKAGYVNSFAIVTAITMLGVTIASLIFIYLI